jgi:hypothetical protein
MFREWIIWLGPRDTEIAFLLPLGVDGVAERVGDLSCIRLGGEWHGVAATHCNSPFNLIKRVGQQGGIGRLHSVTASTNMNDEKAESTEA